MKACLLVVFYTLGRLLINRVTAFQSNNVKCQNLKNFHLYALTFIIYIDLGIFHLQIPFYECTQPHTCIIHIQRCIETILNVILNIFLMQQKYALYV